MNSELKLDSSKMVSDVTDKTVTSVKEKLQISDDGQTILGIIGKSSFDIKDKSCFDVKDLIIPDGITTIEEWAFFKCEEVETITFPKSVKIIKKRAFADCWKLRHIDFPDDIEIIDDYAFANCRELLLTGLPSKAKYIGVGVFQNNLIKAVKIPAGIKDLKLSAFKGCNNIESFDVEAGNPQYSSKDGVLYNKRKTDLLVVPAYANGMELEIPKSVITVREDAFQYCKNINKLVINDDLESFPTEVFNNELKDIDEIEVGKNSKLFKISNGVLYNKSKTELLVVPAYFSKKKLEIPKSVITVRKDAFLHCKTIKKLVINDALENFPAEVFANELKDINEIEVGKNNKLFQMINGVLFSRDGKALIKVVLTSAQIRNFEIPSSVEKIYPRAFDGCDLIRSITIPASVTQIDKDSFSGCTYLRSIKVLCNLHDISFDSFSALVGKGCAAYVPDKWFVEGFKDTALRSFRLYSIEETEEKIEEYLPDIKVVNVSDKDYAHHLCKRVKLVGQMSLSKIEVINHRIYEYLDISEATFGFEEVRWSNFLGYSHHGPVYGRSGVRQEDVLDKFISTIRVSTLVFPDDVEINRINYAKYNSSIKNIIVRDTCERFAYIDGKLIDKETKFVVF